MRFQQPLRIYLFFFTLLATLAPDARGQSGSVVQTEEIPTRLPPISERQPGASRLGKAVRSANLYLGYDRGFLLAADQAVGNSAADANFLMRVNSWAQLRHTYFSSDGPHPNQNTFSFERVRLSFGGHVFSPDMQYFLQLDGNSDRGAQTVFLDYYGTYDVGHHKLAYDPDELGIKFGKWKVPFSRSRAESGRRLQFGERSIANLFFDLNRSYGVAWYGILDKSPVPIAFETALFNGFRTGTVATTRDGGLDRNFGWSLRAVADGRGEFGDDGEPDLDWHDQLAWRCGAGTAYTRISEVGRAEFERATVVDAGVPLASILPPGVTTYDVWLSTIDAHLKFRGLSIIADYYWRYLTQFSGVSVPSLFDHGFNVQSGYFVIPHKLEAMARWSRIVGNSGTLGVSNQSSDQFDAGLGWYFRGHGAKVLFLASYMDGAPLTDSRLDTVAGDVGWFFRTQLQWAF